MTPLHLITAINVHVHLLIGHVIIVHVIIAINVHVHLIIVHYIRLHA